MKISNEARAARKEVQLARLKAKADKKVDYLDYYAKQPLQVAKAEMNDRIRVGRGLLRQAKKDLEIAQATGINLRVAEIAVRDAVVAINGLEQLKQARFKPRGNVTVVTGGAA